MSEYQKKAYLMNSLTNFDKSRLETILDMEDGYVLNFSNNSFRVFFHCYDIDIHNKKYQTYGVSKAKKMRAFWDQEADKTVADVLSGMLDRYEKEYKDTFDHNKTEHLEEGRSIVSKLYGKGRRSILHGKNISNILQSGEMKQQIEQIEENIDTNPAEAIGKSKELMETCCKTILFKSGYDPVEYNRYNIPRLTQEVTKQLKLVPECISHQTQGHEAVRKILKSLVIITQSITELRNRYGTGHGRGPESKGLQPCHARLVVGATVTYVEFITETFMQGCESR